MTDCLFDIDPAGPFTFVNPVDLSCNLPSTNITLASLDNDLLIPPSTWSDASIPTLPAQPSPPSHTSFIPQHSPESDESKEDQYTRSICPTGTNKSPRKPGRRASKVSDDERGKLLEKNRIAANKHRRRKKMYVEGLESRYNDELSRKLSLKAEVSSLRDEVLDLKERLFTHAQCNSHDIKDYIDGRVQYLNAKDYGL